MLAGPLFRRGGVAAGVVGREIQLDTAEQGAGLTVVEPQFLDEHRPVDALADTGNQHALRLARRQQLQPVIKPLLPAGHHDDTVGILDGACCCLWQCQDEVLQSGDKRRRCKNGIGQKIAQDTAVRRRQGCRASARCAFVCLCHGYPPVVVVGRRIIAQKQALRRQKAGAKVAMVFACYGFYGALFSQDDL